MAGTATSPPKGAPQSAGLKPKRRRQARVAPGRISRRDGGDHPEQRTELVCGPAIRSQCPNSWRVGQETCCFANPARSASAAGLSPRRSRPVW
jgi:hypothetical protein